MYRNCVSNSCRRFMAVELDDWVDDNSSIVVVVVVVVAVSGTYSVGNCIRICSSMGNFRKVRYIIS